MFSRMPSPEKRRVSPGGNRRRDEEISPSSKMMSTNINKAMNHLGFS